MRKILILLAAMGITTSAHAGPTTYGRINKEMRLDKQHKNVDAEEYTGVTEVDGFETTFGVKGTEDSDGLKVSYKVELGLNAMRDAGAADRIRVRLAHINIHQDYGTFTFGQDWDYDTIRMLGLDPLTSTGAQLLGLETSNFQGNVAPSAYGLKIAGGFSDQFRFSSQDYSGFKFHITFSKDQGTSDKATGAKHAKVVTLTYDRDFGNMMLNFHLTQYNQDITNSDVDPSYMTVGAKLGFGDTAVSFATTAEKPDNSDGQTVGEKRSHMLVGLSHKIGAGTIAFNMGKTTFDDEETVYAGSTGGTQQSMGLGYIHQTTKNLKTRVVYQSLNMEAKTGNSTLAAFDGGKKASASRILVGGILYY